MKERIFLTSQELDSMFPNDYSEKLFNLLCSTEGEGKGSTFYEKFYNEDESFTQQLRKYRRYLLDNRTEEKKQEFLDTITEQINNREWGSLKSSLIKMFLEPFEEHIFDRIVKMIDKEGLSAENIFSLYDKKYNVKSIPTYKIDYIKSVTK